MDLLELLSEQEKLLAKKILAMKLKPDEAVANLVRDNIERTKMIRIIRVVFNLELGPAAIIVDSWPTKKHLR